MRPVVRNLLPFLLFLAPGCAGGPSEVDSIRPGTPGYLMLPGRVSLPRGSHSPTDCGPETLCAALNFLGINVPISEVEAAVYLPSIKGSEPTHIVAFARRKGAKAKVTERGGVFKLKEQIEAGSPVIIEVTKGGQYHYYLVAGLSVADRVVACAYYEDRQHLLTFELLNELWYPTRYRSITFTVPPAEELALEGWDCLEGGRYELAEELFLKSLKLKPEEPLALSGLGKLRLIQKRFEEAQDLLERALKLMPGDPEALNNLADTILNRKGDAARAERLSGESVASKLREIRELEEDLKVAPPGTEDRIREDIAEAKRRVFYYLGTQGQALERNGKAAASVEARERSFEYAPDDDPDGVGRRHVETALALRTLGEGGRASEHLMKARAVAKEPALQKRIDELIEEESKSKGS
jgi:tetratricopeptide (TPR) repeat protein